MDLHIKDSSTFVHQHFHSNYPLKYFIYLNHLNFHVLSLKLLSYHWFPSIPYAAKISQNTQGKVHPGATRTATRTETPTNRSTETQDFCTSIGRSSRFWVKRGIWTGPKCNRDNSDEETILSHANCIEFSYFYQIFINILFSKLFFMCPCWLARSLLSIVNAFTFSSLHCSCPMCKHLNSVTPKK